MSSDHDKPKASERSIPIKPRVQNGWLSLNLPGFLDWHNIFFSSENNNGK
jgi:hypothetical protein